MKPSNLPPPKYAMDGDGKYFNATKEMKTEIKSVSDIKAGDIVVNKGSGLAYIVTDVIGTYAIAVRTIRIINPSEWEIFTSDLIETTTLPPKTESAAKRDAKPDEP